MERYVDLFTEENRHEIIRKTIGCRNFQIVKFEIEPFSANVDGFLGEHFRGKFEVVLGNGGRKSSQVFIKVKPTAGSNQEMCRLASEANAFATEAFYLTKIVEEGKEIEWAPRLLLGKPEVVVFEDLSLKNYVLSKVDLGEFDLEHCQVVLKSVARFHAFNFSLEEKFVGNFFDQHSEYLTEALFNLDEGKLCRDWTENGINSVEAIIDVLPENYCLTPEEFKRRLREKFYANLDVVRPSKKFTNVICHGDLWMKNMLFKYDENKPINCCLLDFQILRYAPPVSDVVEFLFINTSVKFRKNHLHTMLKYYHQQLEKNLKKLGCSTRISYDEIYASAQDQIDFFKIGSVFYKSILEMGETAINELMKTPGAYQDMMFYDRTPFILNTCRKNLKYRAKIIDYMIEVREMLTSESISVENTWAVIQRYFGRLDFSTCQVTTVPLGTKLGYLGDHKSIFLTVGLDGVNHQVELFMKAMPTSNGSLTFLNETGGFGKETYFYGKILGEFASFGLENLFNAAVPRCYWYCPGKYLIFENLVVQGFKALDKYKKIDFNVAKAMMVTLAKFNAASYIYEEKMSRKLNRNFRIDQEFTIAESYYVYNGKDLHKKFIKNTTEGLNFQIDILLDSKIYNKEILKTKVKELTDKFPDFVKPMSNIRNVICNGDLWATNVMVSEDPIQCRLVDFQTWRYTSPAHDIVTFLFFTSTESFRARHTQKLLKIYYQTLTSELQNHEIEISSILTFDQLESSYNELRPFAAAQAAIFDQFIMIGVDNIQKLFDEDRADLIYGDRIDIISDNCRNDPKYKNILTESIRALCNTL